MLCNPLIQSQFHYTCSAWYPKLNEKLKKKIKIAQNKCVRFCLKWNGTHHISSKEFQSINWLPIYKRVHHCINATAFNFVINVYPYYLNEVYEYAPQCKTESKSNFVNLEFPFRKTNMGQKDLSFIGPSLWNNLPGSLKKNHCF